MAEEIQRIRSISQLHTMSGFEKPNHPLISVIDASDWEIKPEHVGLKMSMDLYTIALKDGSCGLDYGRNTYDFNEGVLIFTAPNQVTTLTRPQQRNEVEGWLMIFHPDLIRNTALGARIDNYGFFSYDVHEALHLSAAEQETLNDCVRLVEQEIKGRIDGHSQSLIVNTLELVLNYSLRYYERQFHTRAAENVDVITHFERLLKQYYQADKFVQEGVPSVDYFADAVHLSPNYLSDLLKKTTGRTAKGHIHHFIVEKAKMLLLSDNDTISGIAYRLGFNYPHYFSRLFKSKTGLTPNQYRTQSHSN